MRKLLFSIAIVALLCGMSINKAEAVAFDIFGGYSGDIEFSATELLDWGRTYIPEFDTNGSVLAGTGYDGDESGDWLTANTNPDTFSADDLLFTKFPEATPGIATGPAIPGYPSTPSTTEDSWGIAKVSTIWEKGKAANTFFADLPPTEPFEITTMFYGFNDDEIGSRIDSINSYTFGAVGGVMDVYAENRVGAWTPFDGLSGGAAARTSTSTYPTVTDGGNLLLRMVATPQNV